MGTYLGYDRHPLSLWIAHAVLWEGLSEIQLSEPEGTIPSVCAKSEWGLIGTCLIALELDN